MTVTTDRDTGSSRPNHSFMLAVSLTELLSSLKQFLLHGKMSGFMWAVIDASFSVYFQRETRRLKGQPKPIRSVCGNTDLCAVPETELVRAVLEGIRCFLKINAGTLGEDEAELVAVTDEFAATIHLDENLVKASGTCEFWPRLGRRSSTQARRHGENDVFKIGPRDYLRRPGLYREAPIYGGTRL